MLKDVESFWEQEIYLHSKKGSTGWVLKILYENSFSEFVLNIKGQADFCCYQIFIT